MNSTNVPSKKENKIRITGSAIYVTDKALEIPKDAIRVDKAIVFGENESMEIPVGEAKLNENGTLELQNGTIITMVNPKVYQTLKANKERKEKMNLKARNTGKAQTGVDR